MLTPGFPSPCIPIRQTMPRAQSMPLAVRQAPPKPMIPPAAR